MSSNEEIREAVKKLAEKPKTELVQVTEATVKSVDWDKRLCTVEDSAGVEFPNVRLRAIGDDEKKGLCMKPKVDSTVLIALVNNNELSAYVCQFTEIDTIELNNGNELLVIDVANGDFAFNGGDNDGMVKIKEVVKQLNVIEKDLNTIKAAFQSWTPSPQDGGAALKVAAGTWYGQTITETTQTDLENTKVKH